MIAAAVEANVSVVWIVMNNFAYGTIAGLEMAHYGTTFGCVFHKDGKPYSPILRRLPAATAPTVCRSNRLRNSSPRSRRQLRQDVPS